MKFTIEKGSYSSTDSTGWDEQACICGTLWRQYYVTTSKKYLINSHAYFAQIFSISVFSATTGKNFVSIDHLLELPLC